MNRKILHLAKDEKFINSANWQFEKAFPNLNEFRIYVSDRRVPLKYVEIKKNIIVYNESQTIELTKDLDKFDLVVLHGLDNIQSTVVLNATSKVKFLWLLFGAEIYSNSEVEGISLIGPLTRRLIRKQLALKKIKEFIKPLYFRLVRSISTNTKVLQVASIIKYFGILYEEEYNFLLEKKVLSPEAKLIKFTYYPLEFIFNGVENLSVSGNNILVGNSASASSNHLESFELINSLNIEGRKIVVPLSYGDPSYARKVIAYGKSRFGDNFEPLTKFMTLYDYNSKLSGCSIVIMNHFRQQAVGTVLAMIWMGAKVYLSKKNTLFAFLKRINVTIFSIEHDLISSNKFIFSPLDQATINRNKEILLSELSTNSTQLLLKKGLKELLTDDY